MSVKAKANMMGELGDTLGLTDRLTDQDWSHYSGKDKGDTVVVFFDGIEVPAWEWWLEGLRSTVSMSTPAKERSASTSSDPQSVERFRDIIHAHSDSVTDNSVDERSLSSEDLWGSDTPLRTYSPLGSQTRPRGRRVRFEKVGSPRSVSTPNRLSKYLAYDESPPVPVQKPRAAPMPKQRLDIVTSTPTSSSSASTGAPSPEAMSSDTSTPPTRHRSELRRKAGSPSLRVPK